MSLYQYNINVGGGVTIHSDTNNEYHASRIALKHLFVSLTNDATFYSEGVCNKEFQSKFDSDSQNVGGRVDVPMNSYPDSTTGLKIAEADIQKLETRSVPIILEENEKHLMDVTHRFSIFEKTMTEAANSSFFANMVSKPMYAKLRDDLQRHAYNELITKMAYNLGTLKKVKVIIGETDNTVVYDYNANVGADTYVFSMFNDLGLGQFDSFTNYVDNLRLSNYDFTMFANPDIHSLIRRSIRDEKYFLPTTNEAMAKSKRSKRIIDYNTVITPEIAVHEVDPGVDVIVDEAATTSQDMTASIFCYGGYTSDNNTNGNIYLMPYGNNAKVLKPGDVLILETVVNGTQVTQVDSIGKSRIPVLFTTQVQESQSLSPNVMTSVKVSRVPIHYTKISGEGGGRVSGTGAALASQKLSNLRNISAGLPTSWDFINGTGDTATVVRNRKVFFRVLPTHYKTIFLNKMCFSPVFGRLSKVDGAINSTVTDEKSRASIHVYSQGSAQDGVANILRASTYVGGGVFPDFGITIPIKPFNLY